MKKAKTRSPASTKKTSQFGDKPNMGIGILQAELTKTSFDGWCQLLPAGYFKAVDGRPHDVVGGQWFLDTSAASLLLNHLRTMTNDRVIDYEHQTLKSEENGQPAPAAGWFNHSEVQWREGKGLLIKPRWTDKARQHIQSGEYKYLSAVFSYDKASGVPLQLKMAALVNYPGIDGMDEAVALAASHFRVNAFQAMSPKELYCRLLALLGIPVRGEEPTETEHKQAMQRVEILTMKTQPNLSEYVPKEAYDASVAELTALQNSKVLHPIRQLINTGIRQQKVFDREVEWLIALGQQQGIAALKTLIDQRKPPSEYSQQATQSGLTKEQEQVLRVCNINRQQYIQTLKQQ